MHTKKQMKVSNNLEEVRGGALAVSLRWWYKKKAAVGVVVAVSCVNG